MGFVPRHRRERAAAGQAGPKTLNGVACSAEHTQQLVRGRCHSYLTLVNHRRRRLFSPSTKESGDDFPGGQRWKQSREKYKCKEQVENTEGPRAVMWPHRGRVRIMAMKGTHKRTPGQVVRAMCPACHCGEVEGEHWEHCNDYRRGTWFCGASSSTRAAVGRGWNGPKGRTSNNVSKRVTSIIVHRRTWASPLPLHKQEIIANAWLSSSAGDENTGRARTNTRHRHFRRNCTAHRQQFLRCEQSIASPEGRGYRCKRDKVPVSSCWPVSREALHPTSSPTTTPARRGAMAVVQRRQRAHVDCRPRLSAVVQKIASGLSVACLTPSLLFFASHLKLVRPRVDNVGGGSEGVCFEIYNGGQRRKTTR